MLASGHRRITSALDTSSASCAIDTFSACCAIGTRGNFSALGGSRTPGTCWALGTPWTRRRTPGTTRRRTPWRSAKAGWEASLLPATEDLLLLRGQDQGSRLQGHRKAPAVPLSPVQDGGSAQDRRVLQAPTWSGQGHQAGEEPGDAAVQSGPSDWQRKVGMTEGR